MTELAVTPISNAMAERAAIGSALAGGGQADVVLELLVADDLVEDLRACEVLDAVRDLRARGSHCDPVLVHAELLRTGRVNDREAPTSGVYLADLAAAAVSPDEAGAYCVAVLEASLRRSIQAAAATLAQSAGEVSLSTLLDTCAGAMGNITRSQGRLDAARKRATLRLVAS